MNTNQLCPDCPAKNVGDSCPCRLKDGNTKNQLKDFLKDIWIALTHIRQSEFGTVFFNLLEKPGATLDGWIKDKETLPVPPFQYFIVCANIYLVLIKFVFIPNNLYVGAINQLDTVDLAWILLGLSIISWPISGGEGITLIKVFSVYAYVYGTAFILNPFILLFESFSFKYLKYLPHDYSILICDLPTTIFILYAMWNLFKVRRIKMYKFWLTAIAGLLYYGTFLLFFK